MGRRGSSAVEMALLTPLLLAFSLGIGEYGLLLTQQRAVGAAATAGAMAGSAVLQDEDPEKVAAAVAQYTVAQQASFVHTPNVSAAVTGTSPEQILTVTVDVDYEPIATGWFSTPETLSSTTVMRLQDQPVP